MTGVPAVPEKKSGRGPIIAVAAAAVIAVAGLAFWQMNKEDPKDIVIKAFEGLMADGQTDPGEEIFGWDAMYEKLYQGSYQMDMGLQMESLLGSTEFAGAGFSMAAAEESGYRSHGHGFRDSVWRDGILQVRRFTWTIPSLQWLFLS